MNDAELTVNTIAELQDKIATQRKEICNLTVMNDELQARLDKIDMITDGITDESNPIVIKWNIKEILEQE